MTSDIGKWLAWGLLQANVRRDNNVDSEEVGYLTGAIEAWEGCVEYTNILENLGDPEATIVEALLRSVEDETARAKRLLAENTMVGGLTDFQRGVIAGYQEIKHKLETML